MQTAPSTSLDEITLQINFDEDFVLQVRNLVIDSQEWFPVILMYLGG